MRISNIKMTDFCTIPGLDEGAIPQGICYSKKYNIFIISSYFKRKQASSLYIIDFKTKEYIKKVQIVNEDNTNFRGHVGGIATDDNLVWITDNYKVLTFSLEEIVTSYKIKIKEVASINNKADNASFSNNILWIGEYNYKRLYKTIKEHNFYRNSSLNKSLLFGYSNLVNINFDKPDFVISIPNRVQGLVQDNFGYFYFSRSFWSFQPSNLTKYNNVLENGTSEYYKINDNQIPLFYITEEDKTKELILPPMSEAIVLVDNDMYILFESASNQYKYYTKNKTDKIKCIKL